MADFPKDYPSTASNGGNRSDCGGYFEPKPIPYSPPAGPKHQFEPGPGLRGGTNHSNSGTQGRR